MELAGCVDDLGFGTCEQHLNAVGNFNNFSFFTSVRDFVIVWMEERL